VLEVAQTTSSLRLDSVQTDYPGATYAPSCIPQVATAWAPAWWCNLLQCCMDQILLLPCGYFNWLSSHPPACNHS